MEATEVEETEVEETEVRELSDSTNGATEKTEDNGGLFLKSAARNLMTAL